MLNGKKLFTWMTHYKGSISTFSDKTMWMVDQAQNSRNDKYLTFCVGEMPPINAQKQRAAVMMLGIVTGDGKRMSPFWFEKVVKINTKVYLRVIRNVVPS